MLITTKGIVIHERSVGENDKYIDVLTKDYGIIEASAKGVKKITSKNSNASQLFTYSNFCFSKSGQKYILNSTEIIRSFYDLRLDLSRLSLASYFAELLKYTVVSDEPSGEVLRLFLNTLHFLCNNDRDEKLLKSIFELRLLTEIGMMPDIVACKQCGRYIDEKMFFNIREGNLTCSGCQDEPLNPDVISVSSSVVSSMRHIVFSDYDKLFNFRINNSSLKRLNYISEQYLLNHLSRSFKTLEFYKSL